MAEDKIQSRLEQINRNDGVSTQITSTGENGEKILACAACRTPTAVEQLTVTSKNRWTYDSSLVVCPSCLEKMQLKLDEETRGSDLIMATVWGLISFLIITSLLCALIWFNRSETFEPLWGYIGAYLLILPGFGVGKAVHFGAGRRDSFLQHWIAVGFTALCLLITNYVNQISFINLGLDIARPDGHALAYIDPLPYLTGYVFQPYFELFFSQPLIALLVTFGIVIGFVVAYMSSSGERLYTRPFVDR